MADSVTPLEGGNDGWAGERGEFGHLSEADVRGSSYVGWRPLDGGVAGAACSMPYQLTSQNPGARLFDGPYAERLEKILSRYPDRQGALLPVLNMAHEVHGHLAPEDMERVAEILGLAPAYVRGVATFYTMYNRRPVGRYLVQVCTNIACNLCGADQVMEAFLEHTSTEPGQTSDDGVFTVIEAECLGACGFPTAVQINDRYFENLTSHDVPAVLDRLRRELEQGENARASATSGSTARSRSRRRGRGD